MDKWDYDETQFAKKSKKFNKKVQNVPIHELGFRPKIAPDIIDPRNMKRIRKTKKKKYIPKSSRQIFLSRLRLIVDVNQLPSNIMSHQFQVNNIAHWAYVKKVIYRTRHQVYCYICLQQQMIAPQITFCGHIFCFHCILMHFKKSENSNLCPVCKESTQEKDLKTCETLYERQLKINDQITFALKYRVGITIYNHENLMEDLNFNQIIRQRKESIVCIFQKQQQEISQQLAKTPETDRNHYYLTNALSITRNRLQSSIAIMQKSGKVPLLPNQKIINNTVYALCDYESIKQQNKFYQQISGRGVYLHSQCRKTIEKNHKQLPNIIKSSIILLDEEEFDPEIAQEYKQLNHLLLGQEFQVTMLNLNQYLSEEASTVYKQEFEGVLKELKQIKQKQQAQALIRNEIYEQQLKERRRLEKLMECQYHDINAPPVLDPSDINQQSFPSLHTAKSMQVQSSPTKVPEKQTKKETEKFTISDNIDDFPDLEYELKTYKSEVTKTGGGKGKRNKKKQKRIDITAQIFANREEDDYY